jgi:hypothetical protein
MTFLNERGARLYRNPETIPEAAAQIHDLRHVVYSLIQEVEALKSVIADMPGFDADSYRAARIERMLQDHSSAGAYSWRNLSTYPYTLDEDDFLRHTLNMTDEEIAAFKERATYLSTLT